MNDREECIRIYKDAFGSSEPFDTMLFDNYFENGCEYLKVDGRVCSLLFKFPCTFRDNGKERKIYYVYAVATDISSRGKGYMSTLINRVVAQSDAPLFLKPVNDGLIDFYSHFDFKTVKAYGKNCGEKIIDAAPIHKQLSKLCSKTPDEYTLMYYSKDELDLSNVCFEYVMS